jgi:uncharacterized protein (TIGR02598 family)
VKSQVPQHGFSLVELTLAIGVAAICLLTIFSVLPIGLQTSQRAIEQTASADILATVAADLRATPVTIPRGSATTSPQFAINIPANPVSSATTTTLFFTSEGQLTPQTANPRYRLTITFLPNDPGMMPAQTATFVDLKVTWPALATDTNTQGSAEMFAAFDRN